MSTTDTERGVILEILKERLKEKFSKWDDFRVEDSSAWVGVDSLPHWPHMVIEDVERKIKAEFHTDVTYLELGTAFLTAMHELGKLSSNGKGTWIYSPLHTTQDS